MKVRVMLIAAAAALLTGACAARLAPVGGEPYTDALPVTRLVGRQTLAFNWEYLDRSMKQRGEGALRTAGPDSARVDIFFAGYDSRYAILIGDGPARSPFGAAITDMLPPPALLWAVAGRLAVPPAPDTLKRRVGDRVVAEIGSAPLWRATFDGSRLARLDMAEGDRVLMTVTRAPDGSVTYVDERRKQTLRIYDVRKVSGEFPPDIWRY